MQILVVVANVQARILKTVVGKGFALTAIVRKIVGPKRNGKTILYVGGGILFAFGSVVYHHTLLPRKGNRSIFLYHRSCSIISLEAATLKQQPRDLTGKFWKSYLFFLTVTFSN